MHYNYRYTTANPEEESDQFMAKPAAQTDSAGDITYGLEFKYLFSVPLDTEDRYSDDGSSTGSSTTPCPESAYGTPSEVSCIAAQYDEQLQQLQRRAFAMVKATIEGVPGQQAITPEQIAIAQRHERDFWRTHWIVKRPNSVSPQEEQPLPGEVLVGVEILAPQSSWISRGNSRKSGHRNLDGVGAVLRRLRASGRLRANYTCDFHVHTGRSDGTPFSLLTMKRLATLLWLAEPIIRLLRNPDSPNFHHKYTWGSAFREASRLARDIPPVTTDPKVQEFLATMSPVETESSEYECRLGRASKEIRAIWQAESVWEIGMLLSGPDKQHRRMGFNFSGYAGEDDRARKGPRTVEFRFLEARTRDDLMVGWVHICCKLVELAMSGCETRFDEVVQFLMRAETDTRSCRERHGERRADSKGCDPLPAASWNPRLGRKDDAFAKLMSMVGVEALWYEPWVEQVRIYHQLEK